jgi:quercetin dioxygenase-like cupin family protein
MPDPSPASPRQPLAPAVAHSLAGLVDYAEGSVVSRTLAANRAGTVTVFAFDSGQGLSEHSAPFDALVHVLDGRAQLTIDGQEVAASAGELVVMPADVPHALHAPSRFKMLLIMIKG